ncbi:non-ribosomal peptide synthetase, partial [Rhodococcus oxybenzonivorans]
MDSSTSSDPHTDRFGAGFPLSSAQRGMWLAQRLTPEVPLCIAQYVEVHGPLDVALLDEASVTAAREFHSPYLRIFEVDGEPFQVVDPTLELSTEYVDLRAAADPVAAAHTWMEDDYTRPLDPEADMLAASAVLHVGDQHYLWYSRIHHVALDGYGAMTMVNRIAALYTAAVQGRPPEPNPAADLRTLYALDQQYRSSSRFEADRDYWAQRISGFAEGSSLSEVVSPAVAKSILLTTSLSDAASERLMHSDEVFGVPAAGVVVAAFGCYLARMSGRENVLLSLPVSGRTTTILRRSGGMLVSLAPLHISSPPEDRVDEMLRRSQLELMGALRHQRYTLEDIRRDAGDRSSGRRLTGPMVNVMLFHPEITLGPVTGEFHVVTSGPVEDLLVNVYRSGTPERTLVEFRGNPHRYTDEDLRRHHSAFVALLQELLEARPEDATADVHLESAAEGARRRRKVAALDYWKQTLDGLSANDILPTDHPRPVDRTLVADGRVDVRIPAELHQRMHSVGADCRFAAFSAIHTGLVALLSRLGSTDDIAVGTSGGPGGGPLILRTLVDSAQTFTDVLGRVRDTELGAYTHSDVPFDEIAAALGLRDESSGRYPFQIGLEFVGTATDASPTDGADLSVVCSAHPDCSGVDIQLLFATALFEPDTVREFGNRLVHLLDVATLDSGSAVGDFDVLTPAECANLVPALGPPALPPRLLPDILTSAAEIDPDAVAVSERGTDISYRELDEESNQLARLLIARGAGPDTIVALALPRSSEFVLALWAVAKSGAAFLPVDPNYPQARIEHMLTDSGAVLGVTDHRHRLRSPAVSWLDLDDTRTDTTVAGCSPTRVTQADRLRPLRRDHAAYLIYTSGSTGIPKGVSVGHRGIADLVSAEREGLEISPESRVSHFASPSFDASIFELLGAFGAGARVVIVPPAVVGGAELTRILADEHVSHAIFTPTTAATLDPAALPELTDLALAGEASPPELVARWASAARRVRNAYGPTEATIMSTLSPPLAPGQRVTLGGPIRGFSILVLDSRLHPVPPGVAGEVYLGGPGLARGYHRRPGLTAARFVADPHGPPGERLYRTGDVAAWRKCADLPDGTPTSLSLEYLGRSDFQVKIRGFRIELGEIDAVLMRHPTVSFAATVDRATSAGDPTLVAYVRPVQGAQVDVPGLETLLRRTLPRYMLPSAIVPLDEVPLTPGGKLDRAALPAPTFLPGSTHRKPATPTEATVAAVWETVLGVSGIGADDDYFDLGGNSLTATRVVARVNAALGTTIGVAELFEAPTVATLAARLDRDEHRGPDRPALAPVARPAVIPLSSAQQRMWFINQYDTTSPAYNIPLVVRLTGRLDVPALVAAIGDIVERHESLRTVFPASPDGPHQVVLPAADAVPVIEPIPVENESELAQRLSEVCSTRFDVATAVPLRCTLLQLGDSEYLLALVLHHIAADGASTAPLARDVTTAYAARTAGHAPQWPPLAVQYVDYTLWQRALLGSDTDPDSLLSRQLDYWTETLSGSPALLELPTDHPRPDTRSLQGGRVEFAIDPELHGALLELARTSTSTVFMVLHAALAVLLARLSGSDDVAVGTPVAGRGEAALDDVVGMFVNTVVLRTKTDQSTGFGDTLRHVRDTDLAAFGHTDIPFEQLVEVLDPPRSSAYSPLFQVLLEFEHILPSGRELHGLELPGLRLEPVDYDAGMAKFDLQLWLSERLDTNGSPLGMQAGVVYATDLFDEQTVRNFAERFVRILEAVTDNPQTPIGDIEILDAAERDAALTPWRQPVALSESHTLADALLRAAATSPSHGAVTYAGDTVSYAELATSVTRLARLLINRTLTPETVVGVAIPRSVDWVVTVLAVIAAGGACLPVEVTWPRPRVEHALTSADPAMILTHLDLAAELPDTGSAVVVLDAPDTVHELAATSDAPLTHAATPDSAAYVLFTAGSTAPPKPVSLSHRTVLAAFASASQSFGFDCSDVWTTFPTHTVDLSVWELWGALLHGGRLLIVDDDTARSPRETAALIAHEHVTVLSRTPTAFDPILRALPTAGSTPLSAPRLVVLGGEAVSTDLAARLSTLPASTTAVQMYASTETVTWVAASEVLATAHQKQTLPLIPAPGRPLAILDRRLHIVPAGVVGELYVGGPALARGYHGRARATSTRFVASPFGGPGERMYRTGDLARTDRDGCLHIVGRSDFRSSLRGYRIPLDEIDAAMSAHTSIDQAVTVDYTTRSGDHALVSYVTPAASAEVEQGRLTEFAATLLPAHCIPAEIVELDTLPVDDTGAVDRTALPVPESLGYAAEFRAPRTPREEAVASVFAQVLGVEGVGVDDNFFELGGTSLIATKVVARLNSALGTGIGVRALFEAPTVQALAAVLDAEDEEASLPPLRPRDRTRPVPVSFAQQRMWFVNQFDTSSAAYNIPMVVRISGPLDIAALSAALMDVVTRHESLRTVYPLTDEGPVQVVQPVDAAQLELTPIPILDDKHLRERIDDVIATTFDVTVRAPLRAEVFRVDPFTHVFALVVHHIAADGWSLVPLARDMTTAYAARTQGHAPDWKPLPVQYGDFALWQREVLGSAEDPTSPLSEQLTYWRTTLADLPERLELPADRPRPSTATYQAATARFTMSPATHRRLTEMAREHDATPFVTVHAALAVLLSRLGNTGDVTVGSPIAGRGEQALDDLVGMFVGTLVLRTRIDPALPFDKVLARVRETDVDAFAHADIPFERLVEELNPARSTAAHPLFQVMLSFLNLAEAKPELPGLRVSTLDLDSHLSQFDLNVVLREHLTDDGAPGGITGEFVYSTDLFDEATVRRFVDMFLRVIDTVSYLPTTVVGDIHLLDSTELERALDRKFVTRHDLPGDTILDLFDAQVARAPEDTAVVFEGNALTYREFDSWTNQLARILIGRGIGPECVVALALPRSFELLAGMFAVVKAGAALLALDLGHPPERIAYLLESSAPALVLTVSGVDVLIPPGTEVLALDVLDLEAVDARPVTDADRIAPLHPENLAYVVYTSGSTGRPKGVAVSHAAITNQLAWSQSQLPLLPGDRTLQKAPIAFDVAIWESFSALCAGSALVVLRPDGHLDLEYLTTVLSTENITVVEFVPSMLEVFVGDHRRAFPSSLRRVFSGGEALPARTADRVLSRSVALGNMYGPAEASVTATYCDVTSLPLTPVIPIGTPVWNTRVYLLDHRLHPAPRGVAAEMYISGAQLARGYLGRPDLTALRFIPDPNGAPGSRMYRTGDLARHNSLGQIEYLGRSDFQIQLHGYRVEPGEIESTLLRHPGVAQAVVALHRDSHGADHLIGYVVPEPDAEIDGNILIDHAASALPSHMVPSTILILPSFPLTPNGKVDRGALPAPDFSVRATSQRMPSSEVERVLAALFAEVLGLDAVGVDDSFFALGGDSIMAIQLVARARTAGLTVQPRDVFEHKTVSRLARAVSIQPFAAPTLEELPGGDIGELPPTPVIAWLLELGGDFSQFSQAALLTTPAGVDQETLTRTLEAVVEHHAALRARLRLTPGRDPIMEVPAGPAPGGGDLLRRVAVASVTGPEFHRLAVAELEAAAGRLDPARGVMLQAVWFDASRDHRNGDLSAQEGRLLLVIHHLAVDGVSWRILVPDLAAAWEDITAGRDPDLPENGTSMRRWAHALVDTAPERAGELDLWRRILDGPDPLLGSRSLDPVRDTRATSRDLTVDVPTGVTEALLADVPKAFHAGTDDALLTALAIAIAVWRHRRGLRVNEVLVTVEGHGRGNSLIPGADLSRTVGWFTTIHPVRLDLTGIDLDDALHGGDAAGTAIKTIKEQLRTIPDHGAGYGQLRYLDPDTAEELRTYPDPQITFNYLGRFTTAADVEGRNAAWAPVEDADLGGRQNAEMPAPAVLSIDAAAVGAAGARELKSTWTYAAGVLTAAEVGELADLFTTALTALTTHTHQPHTGGHTPTDFDLVHLDQHTIDTLEHHYPTLTDIWPLSPLQAGLLFHSEYTDHTLDTYTVQLTLDL